MEDLTQMLPACVRFEGETPEAGKAVLASVSPGVGSEVVISVGTDSDDPLHLHMNRTQLQAALDATPTHL